MYERLSRKTIIIGFCLVGMVFGILAICSGVLRSHFIESVLAFFAPTNRVESSYFLLAVYFGVEMITISSLYMTYAFDKQQMDHMLRKNYHRILLFLCGSFSLLALSISINRWFGPDEFEHVHSAWYVARGYLPYTDFFQLHNPLLWYSLAPFLRVFGYTVQSVVMFRILMFLLTMGIAYSTYILSQEISGSEDAADTPLISVILLLSVVMFVGRSVEIRPDVPQVFLGTVSVYALIRYFRSGKLKYIVISALAASISFIFLQKTVFLLMAYAAIFFFKFIKREISSRPLVYFAICFFLPVSFFFASMILTFGSLTTYFITNVALNTDRSLASFSPFVHVKAALVLNCVFWLLVFFSLVYTFVSRRMNEEMKTIAFIAAVLLLSIFLVKHPYEQYFMQAIPLLCVVVGGSFDFLRRRYNLSEMQSLTLIIIVIAVPLLWLSYLGLHNTNKAQLDKANYVIWSSGEDDLIYDGSNQFNLYRHDLHYFWYNFEKLPVFNRLTNDKYADYDVCTLIKSKKPAFISDYRVNMKRCGLDDMYTKTRFDGLFVRKVKQGFPESNP